MSDIRKKTVQGLKAGEVFSITRTFTEREMILFADITRDYNPIHFDDRFVEVKNLNGRICHGLLVAGMLTEIGGQIGWLASGMDLKFKKPVYFGDTVQCDFTISEIDDAGRARADVVYRNQHDAIVAEAVLTGILPGEPEKEVMRSMLAEGDPTNRIG
ncbi:MAG: MaoC family dehydratase [Proteobacteria bacterium]|nr:MaoC family dehydratase [Pseudomonadota bacterium]